MINKSDTVSIGIAQQPPPTLSQPHHGFIPVDCCSWQVREIRRELTATMDSEHCHTTARIMTVQYRYSLLELIDMDSTLYSSTLTTQDFRTVDSTPDDDVTGGGEDEVDEKRSHSVREAMEQRLQSRTKRRCRRGGCHHSAANDTTLQWVGWRHWSIGRPSGHGMRLFGRTRCFRLLPRAVVKTTWSTPRRPPVTVWQLLVRIYYGPRRSSAVLPPLLCKRVDWGDDTGRLSDQLVMLLYDFLVAGCCCCCCCWQCYWSAPPAATKCS
jgi:hypothetical protein